jgi:polysaccharide pyruvyl transferase WcaK-like protein
MATVFSVIAATIYGNRGAEAMLETVVGRLREQRPDARFHVFTYYPEDDARLLKADGVTLHSSTPAALVLWLLPWSLLFGVFRRVFGRGVLRFAPRAVRALGESIALVDLAGVAFIDGREKFLPFNVLTLLPAWLVGTPVVKMSQAVGPFRKPVNRLAAAFMLRRCARVWARGERTWQHLDQAGFKGVDFARADDIAFNHKQGYSLSDEAGPELQQRFDALSTARGQGVRGVIGICPSSVVAVQSRKNGGNYEQVLAGLVDDLAAQGFLVVLFPNATRALAGEAERNNDLPVIRRILQALSTGRGGAAPVAFDLDVNATDIKRIIAEMDVVLVSRFHAMVGALSLSVPVAVLGWSHKYAEVMARFGQEQWVMDYKELSREELRRQVEAVFAQRADVRAQVLERLPEVKASAARPVDSLLTPSLGAGVA